MHLTHRNRFIETRAARFNSAAVPPLQRRGLMLRIRFAKSPNKEAKRALSAGEGGPQRSESHRVTR